jgi:hypothetical protein
MITELSNYKNEINRLFQDYEFFDKWDLVKLKFPNDLFFELDEFISECKRIKESPFKYLKFHNNQRETNFQVSIPSYLIERSFTFPYLIHLGEFFVNKLTGADYENIKRHVTLRRWSGHFDSYDMWAVFSYKNDRNLSHIHSAPISGIIYYTDSDIPTQFTNKDNQILNVYGQKGDVVIFPGNLYHMVDVKLSDNERITIPFNLNYNLPK